MTQYIISSERHNQRVSMEFDNSADARTFVDDTLLASNDWKIAEFDGDAPRKAISIPFTTNDIEELGSGEEFDWTFDGVDVHVYKDDSEQE